MFDARRLCYIYTLTVIAVIHLLGVLKLCLVSNHLLSQGSGIANGPLLHLAMN